MKQTHRFEYMHYDSLGHLPEVDRELVGRAREACATSHSPFSGFRVGAAAQLRSGMILAASNQESPVGPVGVCAERNLLYHHQANHAGDMIESIAIVSDPDQRECYPCGMCRQVLADSEQRQSTPVRVIMAGREGATVVGSARDLLPFTFELFGTAK